MTIMSILFVAMILVSSQRLNQIIRESLETRYQRELAEQTIRYQAQYDGLTEIYPTAGCSCRHCARKWPKPINITVTARFFS
jgi:type II secretory pathway pseudopilin PulG